MSDSACFKPRVIEPVVVNQPEGLGLAVELWLAHPVDGIPALVDDIRASIGTGEFDAFKDEFLGRFYRGAGSKA